MKAIQNQNLGDLSRSRAIAAASGIEAMETIRIAHDIEHPRVAYGYDSTKRSLALLLSKK
jgi:hypothetical protein